MLRDFFMVLPLLFAAPALAVQVSVQDPCSSSMWLSTETAATIGDNFGDVTVQTLQREAIPFVGSASGLSSIKQSPRGDDALEIISDSEMRAYGWCYRVNGVEPAVYANEVKIEKDTDQIYWFYASAHYVRGEWLDYCTPTHNVRPPFICH